MKVSQIIEMVDKFLNLQLPRVLFEPNGEEVLLQQEAKTDKVQSLVDCCNVVCDELAHNYAPLYRKKVVNASDGIVPFEDLDDLIEVFSLKDSDGFLATFIYGEEGLSTKNDGQYTVVYSIKPPKADFFGDIVAGLPAIDERIFAYGVCAEYCLRMGMYDDMAIWDSRFKSALAIATRKKTPLNLKQRSWC